MTDQEDREYQLALIGIEELATMIQVLDHSQLFDHAEHHADILLGATMFGYIARRAKTLFAAISGEEVSS